MNINSQYLSLLNQQATNTSSSSTKSLADYMNEGDSGKSAGASYFSDSVQLSPEAYAAIREHSPEMLTSLGYEEESSDALLENSSGSMFDSIKLSEEAYASLRETNPELLQSLGYNIEED